MKFFQPRLNNIFIFVEINSKHFNIVFELQVLQPQRVAMSFGFRNLLQMLDFSQILPTHIDVSMFWCHDSDIYLCDS